jgi:hypothetical protein
VERLIRGACEREDAAAKLALAMFSYRVRLGVGAYLAALGDAEAVLFGRGIGENSPWLREAVCEGYADGDWSWTAGRTSPWTAWFGFREMALVYMHGPSPLRKAFRSRTSAPSLWRGGQC